MAFYSEGLRFECARCGVCCCRPGYIYLEPGEPKRIAEHLELSLPRFLGEYTCRDRDGNLSIKFNREDERCHFWKEGVGCGIYEVRPIQCRTFPFWPENLMSRSAWSSVARFCPGLNRGRLYPLDEIVRRMNAKPGDF